LYLFIQKTLASLNFAGTEHKTPDTKHQFLPFELLYIEPQLPNRLIQDIFVSAGDVQRCRTI